VKKTPSSCEIVLCRLVAVIRIFERTCCLYLRAQEFYGCLSKSLVNLYDTREHGVTEQTTVILILIFIIKEYNPSIHDFDVATVDCSCVFPLLQRNRHPAVYQKYTKVGSHPDNGYFGVTETCSCNLQLQ
jgi:hypothetical protein